MWIADQWKDYEIIDTSKGMSARASKSVVNNGIANISDDTILRLIKKKQ